MKLLTATATASTQGARSNDFDFCVEGELVGIGFICATDERDPDGGCGCGRAFFGLSSHRATTTAQVRDLPLSRDDVVEAFAAYYKSAGYGSIPAAILQEEFDGMQGIFEDWPVNTIVERRLEVFAPRSIALG